MLLIQSQGSELEAPPTVINRKQWTLCTRFISVHALETKLDSWFVAWLKDWAPPPPSLLCARSERFGLFINHVDITAQIWGACLNICNIVLYNSSVNICRIPLVKMDKWGGVVTLAGLSVPHLRLSCFLWSVLHFSPVCFALELSILE